MTEKPSTDILDGSILPSPTEGLRPDQVAKVFKAVVDDLDEKLPDQSVTPPIQPEVLAAEEPTATHPPPKEWHVIQQEELAQLDALLNPPASSLPTNMNGVLNPAEYRHPIDEVSMREGGAGGAKFGYDWHVPEKEPVTPIPLVEPEKL